MGDLCSTLEVINGEVVGAVSMVYIRLASNSEAKAVHLVYLTSKKRKHFDLKIGAAVGFLFLSRRIDSA